MELLIDDICHWHETLHPELFNTDKTLKPNVREVLLEISEKIYPGAKLFPDIVLVGSHTSYYYHKHSDLDIGFCVNLPFPKIDYNKEFTYKGIKIDYGFANYESKAWYSLPGAYSLKHNEWHNNTVVDKPTEQDKVDATRLYNRLKNEINDLVNNKASEIEIKQYLGLTEEQSFEDLKYKKPYKSNVPLDEVIEEAMETMGFSCNLRDVKNRIYRERQNNVFHPIVLATKLIVKNGYYEKLTGIKLAGQI